MIDILSLTLFAWLVLQCTSQTESDNSNQNQTIDSIQAQTEAPVEKEKTRPTDRKFNDLARFIAGMPSLEGSSYARYEENAGWQQYAQSAQGTWDRILQTKVPTMTGWRQEELKALNQAGGLAFYPFSGPDFLHASIFFQRPKPS
ncbi:MAG: hypothetical protein HC880_12460 [Bacteroidia bacterium]|nr:hypothetical protein [Bacteroidia bacterium]